MGKDWNETIQSDEFKALSKPADRMPHAPQAYSVKDAYTLELTGQKVQGRTHWAFVIMKNGTDQRMGIKLIVGSDGKQIGDVEFDALPLYDLIQFNEEIALLIAAFLTCQFERIYEVMMKNAAAQAQEQEALHAIWSDDE